MKRLATLTISLLLAFSALGGITAFAEEGDVKSNTIYPQNKDFIKTLAFSELNDYEVGDGVYYFADGKNFYKYEDGELSTDKPEEFGFSPARSEVSIEKCIYYFDNEGTLTVHEKIADGATVTFEGEYSMLKQFGDAVYAVKGNVLYSFDGTQNPKEVVLEYADYTATQKIIVGQAPYALKNYSALKFVSVEAGAYMTAIDLTAIDGEFFKLKYSDEELSENDELANTVRAGEGTTALLLGYSGNAAIVAIGDDSYILLKANTKETEVDCYTEKEFDNATIIGNRIYASPYVIIGTSAVADATGTIVSVLNKLEYEGVLGSAYYEVLYLTENGTKVGYVADGFLTEYIIEDNKDPSIIPDPDHSEKNSVKTVLLILAVVVLVLIAISYIAYVGLSDKRKNKANEKEPPRQTDKE